MISRVKDRLAAIENEINMLLVSNTHQLLQRASKAKEDGNDLLKQMADDLDRQIEEAKEKLEHLRKEYGIT